MILVDTSVWIEYRRGSKRTERLGTLLSDNEVASHPWIFGELMMGTLTVRREETLKSLLLLPQFPVYSVEELYDFVERSKLYGKGLSLVDLQLLYAAIAEGCSLWTFDRRLELVARRYGVFFLM